MRPIVLLDCDGPMANFPQAYLNAIEEETDINIPVSVIDKWKISDCDFFKSIANKLKISPEFLEVSVEDRVIRPGFCSSIVPQPAAREAVYRLTDIADVYIVTSPWDNSPTWAYERANWLKKHFDIPTHRIVSTAAKHLIRGDFFVDDKIDNVVSWQSHWPSGHSILFEATYNLRPNEYLARAGWSAIIEMVKEHAV